MVNYLGQGWRVDGDTLRPMSGSHDLQYRYFIRYSRGAFQRETDAISSV
jgi:hypothetical protein